MASTVAVLHSGLLQLAQALPDELLQRCSLRSGLALLGASLCGQVLWWQYSILLNRNLPHYTPELPVLGSTFEMLWNGYVPWARALFKQSKARLTSFLCVNGVLVSWPVYEKYVKKADNGGQLDQGQLPSAMARLLGEHSMLLMKAGKGQDKHHRLRSKVMMSLAPKRVLALVPEMTAVIREMLDKMAEETRLKGCSRLQDHVSEIPKRITALPIAGGMQADASRRFYELVDAWLAGLIALPVDLGRFSTYGRALKAKDELEALIKDMLSHPTGESGNVIADLATSSAEGAGFSEMEIVDTVLTLFFAGEFTTTEALPPLFAELARRPEWAAKIAAEPLEFEQLEGDGATVRFVREVLRHWPPEVLFQRQSKGCPLDLGEHGQVPAGCNVMAVFGEAMWSMGEDFDPDRWTHSAVHDSFLTFGGTSPHSCVGRNVAMVELQVFARILCREYDFQILDTTRVRNWTLGGMTYMYKDGCKVTVSKKAAQQ